MSRASNLDLVGIWWGFGGDLPMEQCDTVSRNRASEPYLRAVPQNPISEPYLRAVPQGRTSDAPVSTWVTIQCKTKGLKRSGHSSWGQ